MWQTQQKKADAGTGFMHCPGLIELDDHKPLTDRCDDHPGCAACFPTQLTKERLHINTGAAESVSEVVQEHRRVDVNSFDCMKAAESSQPGNLPRHPQPDFGRSAHTLRGLHPNEYRRPCTAYVRSVPGFHSCSRHGAHHRCRLHGPERPGAPVYHQASRRSPRWRSDADKIRVCPDMRKVEREGSCFGWEEEEGDAVEPRRDLV